VRRPELVEGQIPPKLQILSKNRNSGILMEDSNRMIYYLYILKCQNGKFYTGTTNNLNKRLKQHQTKINGAKFTKDFHFKEYVYHEVFQTRALAMKREKQIKGWSKIKKEALIAKDYKKLKELSRSRSSKD